MNHPKLYTTLFFSFYFLLSAHGQDLSYTVSTAWLEMGSDSVALHVEQSGTKAIATMGEGGRITKVSDPESGIRSASIDKRMGFLLDGIGSMEPYKVGDIIDLGFDNSGIVKSFEYSLEKGKNKQSVQGYKTSHYILSVKLEWSQTDDNGQETVGISSGKSDLWITDKLPFSWLPYTLAMDNNQKAAVPLSFLHPEIAAFLLDQYEDKLSRLGFLLKARAESEQRYVSENSDYANQYVKEVTVFDIEEKSNVSIDIPEMPQISMDKYTEIMSWFFITNSYCNSESGSINSSKNEAGSIMVEGSAQFKETDDKTGISWLAMGMINMSTPEEDNGCLVIGMHPSELTSATYPVLDQNSFGKREENQPAALVCYLALRDGIPQLTIFSEGNFSVNLSDGVKSTLEARGTTIILQQDKASQIQEAKANFIFDILR